MRFLSSKAGRVLTLVTGALILLAAFYIVVNRIGLADHLDFGAGAYYYADIPNFQELEQEASSYSASVPMWVHILLFLLWGALMYALWCFLDRPKKHRPGQDSPDE